MFIKVVSVETHYERPSAVNESAGRKSAILASHWSKVPRENHVTRSFAPDLQHSDVYTRRGKNRLNLMNLFLIKLQMILVESKCLLLNMSG